MTQPMLVRSSMRTWDFGLLMLAGIGLFIGGWVLIDQGHKALGITFQVIAVVWVVASAIAIQRRIVRRQWINLRDDGFTLIDRCGETEYEDSQVRSLTLKIKQNYSEGIVKSITRTVYVWLDRGESDEENLTRVEFEEKIPMGAADKLTALIERLSKRVLDRARQKIADGSMFSGQGWAMERQNMVIAAKPEPLHGRLDDIVATGIVDDKLCLWKEGQDEVWAKIDINSINAYVLKWLIDERLADRPEDKSRTASKEGLGRVIFERKASTTTKIVLACFTIISLLAGIGLIVAGNRPLQNDQAVLIAFGLLAILASCACAIGFLYCRKAVFRCQQYGLVKTGLFSSRSLRYEHVESFTYQSTRMFVNGAYTGTQFMLDFIPDAEHKSQRIRYSPNLRGSDGELDHLRDQISSIIGYRMMQKVLAGTDVKWTPALRFQGSSLIYTAAGFVGRKAAVSIPIADIASYRLDQGQCHLFRNGESKPLVQENMHTTNFHPGFHCLLLLINSRTPEAANSNSDQTTKPT